MKKYIVIICVLIGWVPLQSIGASQSSISQAADSVLSERWPQLDETIRDRVATFYEELFLRVNEVVTHSWFLDQVEIDLKVLPDQVWKISRPSWETLFSDQVLQESVEKILNYPEDAEENEAEYASRIEHVVHRTMSMFNDSERWAFPTDSVSASRLDRISRDHSLRTGLFTPPWQGLAVFRFELASTYLEGVFGYANHLLETNGNYLFIGFRNASEKGEKLKDREVFFRDIEKLFESLNDVEAAPDLNSFILLMLHAGGLVWESRYDISGPPLVDSFLEATEDFREGRGEFVVYYSKEPEA